MLVKNHFLNVWNEDPNVTLEELWDDCENISYEKWGELENDLENLQKEWMNFYPASDSRHWLSIEPTKELMFLRSLFPCSAACRHNPDVRSGSPYESLKKQEEEIWLKVKDEYKKLIEKVRYDKQK